MDGMAPGKRIRNRKRLERYREIKRRQRQRPPRSKP